MDSANVSVQIISDEQVLHPSNAEGTLLGRVVTAKVTVNGIESVGRQEFWYDWSSGRLAFIR